MSKKEECLLLWSPLIRPFCRPSIKRASSDRQGYIGERDNGEMLERSVTEEVTLMEAD